MTTTPTQISPVVTINDGKAVTTSIAIAEYFNKRHDDVLKKIRFLDCSPEFNARNFAEVKYTDSKDEKRPAYALLNKSEICDDFLPIMWGGKHFWTLRGNDGLAGSPLLARLTVILRILDSSQKNERKMIFLHYILDWVARGLSKFESRLNSFDINKFFAILYKIDLYSV